MRIIFTNSMFIGAHISIAGGVFNAPENAHRIGCECFQLFTRSPRGGQPKPLTPDVVKQFESECKKYKLKITMCMRHII